MSLNPRVCKKSYKVHIPMMGEACEFWLITVTDEQSITNPDKDHAYLTDDGKLFVFNGDSLVRVNCDICFTQEEREKLEGIEENANNYTLPEADSNKLGGVILGYTQNGKNYPVVKDSDGRIYVQVPWEEYQLPKATDNALGGIKTGYKQNGKFYPIKTDTDGNAYVQVPWEDTNTVYEVVSKTSNGLMPMLPSDENASKRFLNGDGEWVVGTDNSINGVTQTGSTFSGETSDCGVQITRVVGKTSQKTTNGYQLFDASKISSLGGITATKNDDGSITLNGTATANADFFKIGDWGQSEVVLSGTTKWKADVSNSNIRIYGVNVTNQEISTELSTAENSYTGELTYFLIRVPQGRTVNNFTFKFMLYQDGDGTWEPFTGGQPAPNPDYPMDIENVKISEIESVGKNLLKDNGYSYNSTYEYIYSNSYIPYIFKSIKPNKTYTAFIYGELNLENGIFRICNTNAINDNSNNGVIISNRKVVFKTPSVLNPTYQNVVYIGLRLSEESAKKVSDLKIMIVEGDHSSEDLEYQDFQGYNTVETSLKLAQDDIYQQGTITRDRKQVVFDGSSDENWNLQSINEYGIANFVLYVQDIKSSSLGKSNRFKFQTSSISVTQEEGFSLAQGTIYIRINEETASTVENFRTWLSTHNTVVEYELATPTTEEFKVPTIPSYEPYTEISTNSVVDPTITFKPLPYTTCLVGEATEEESGYMPKLSGNASQFLNGQGEWSTPSGYTLPTASTSQLGGVKIGSNISISDGAISIDKDNVTEALGYTPPTTNTTYEKVDKSSDGLCPKLPNENTTTKYLRQDGAWEVPPNTTYEVASTSADGLMSSSDKTKLTNLRRIWKGTSSSPPSGWVDGDIYVQYEE